MTKYIKAWIVTALAYFVIDLVVRMFVLGPLAQGEVAGIMRPMSSVNGLPLLLEYLLVPSVILYFVVQTKAFQKPLSYSGQVGAVLGVGILGTYELINSALLLKWTSSLVALANTLGGAVIVALATMAAASILKRSKLHKAE